MVQRLAHLTFDQETGVRLSVALREEGEGRRMNWTVFFVVLELTAAIGFGKLGWIIIEDADDKWELMLGGALLMVAILSVATSFGMLLA